MTTVTRYHDFCAGHRVVGHESKCKNLHGHNYRVHFTIASNDELDSVGRVIDFSVIKSTLCQWLEDNWDHKMLLWEKDPIIFANYEGKISIVRLPFNPTAENMAQYLVLNIAPGLLDPYGVRLVKVVLEETRKCSVTYEI